MRNRHESPTQRPAKDDRKKVGNWMQLEIAPLVATRMERKKLKPRKGH